MEKDVNQGLGTGFQQARADEPALHVRSMAPAVQARRWLAWVKNLSSPLIIAHPQGMTVEAQPLLLPASRRESGRGTKIGIMMGLPQNVMRML